MGGVAERMGWVIVWSCILVKGIYDRNEIYASRPVGGINFLSQ